MRLSNYKNFANFSNSFRKAFTRQRMANLLGSNAPSQSYVDQIQSARRGVTNPIDSRYYISRHDVMTHPHDNKMLVAAQKKFQRVAGSDTNEYGMVGYRPINLDMGDREYGYLDTTIPRPKSTRLKLGNIVEGDFDGVSLRDSLPLPKLNDLNDWPSRKYALDMKNFYNPVIDIHSHPEGLVHPSKPDTRMANKRKSRNNGDYESLIYIGENSKGSENAPYSMTSYGLNPPKDFGKGKSSQWYFENKPIDWSNTPGLGGEPKPKSSFSSKIYFTSADFCR